MCPASTGPKAIPAERWEWPLSVIFRTTSPSGRMTKSASPLRRCSSHRPNLPRRAPPRLRQCRVRLEVLGVDRVPAAPDESEGRAPRQAPPGRREVVLSPARARARQQSLAKEEDPETASREPRGRARKVDVVERQEGGEDRVEVHTQRRLASGDEPIPDGVGGPEEARRTDEWP